MANRADIENPEAVRMITKSGKVVDAIVEKTLERLGANIDLALQAFNFEAEKSKFLGK